PNAIGISVAGSGTTEAWMAMASRPGTLAPSEVTAPVVGLIVTRNVLPGAPGLPGPPSVKLTPSKVPSWLKAMASMEPVGTGAPERVATVVTAPVARLTVLKTPEAPAAARYAVPDALIANPAPELVIPASPTRVAAPVVRLIV